ncbi:hypothetical protein GCM10010360_28510 [Streptomyces nogalater]
MPFSVGARAAAEQSVQPRCREDYRGPEDLALRGARGKPALAQKESRIHQPPGFLAPDGHVPPDLTVSRDRR